MAILDGRTLITANNTTANIDDLAGAATGNQNTETYIEGTASVSSKISQATGGLLYDYGTAQNFSSNHFYFWWNVSTAGLLNTKSAGGIRIRFCGATVTDFFEVYVEGKDTYSGGWKMTVLGIEDAKNNPSNTGGTPPATSAIRYVGLVFNVSGMISGNVDNCFLDAMWRLPDGVPGIKVEGLNTGSTAWTWDDVVSAGDAADTTKAWGSIFRRDGVIFVNTPIRFGTSAAVTNGFSDTSEVIAFEDHRVGSDFYQIDVINGSIPQYTTFGARSGTGDISVGYNGCVFTAASTGKRYSIKATNSNIDQVEFLGCTFSHGSNINIAHTNTEFRSCVITDCNSLLHSTGSLSASFQKNTVTGANTGDGVAFITTDNPSEIKGCSFVFSDGHAMEITATGTNQFSNNTFAGYGTNTDAAIYNNSGGTVVLQVTGVGDTSPSVRNGSGASTTINKSVSITVTCVDSSDNTAVENARVAVFEDDGTQLMNELTSASGVATELFDYTEDVNIVVRIRKSSDEIQYLPVNTSGIITEDGFTLRQPLTEDLTIIDP